MKVSGLLSALIGMACAGNANASVESCLGQANQVAKVAWESALNHVPNISVRLEAIEMQDGIEKKGKDGAVYEYKTVGEYSISAGERPYYRFHIEVNLTQECILKSASASEELLGYENSMPLLVNNICLGKGQGLCIDAPSKARPDQTFDAVGGGKCSYNPSVDQVAKDSGYTCDAASLKKCRALVGDQAAISTDGFCYWIGG